MNDKTAPIAQPPIGTAIIIRKVNPQRNDNNQDVWHGQISADDITINFRSSSLAGMVTTLMERWHEARRSLTPPTPAV